MRDDRPFLLLDGAVDAVGQVLADARLVGVDRADRELVELVQLLGDGDGRAGHPAQRAVAPDEGLHHDPVEHGAGGAGLEPLHRLDGGLQPVRPALQVRHAAAGVVDQLDLPVAHEVVDVAVQQRVGVERDVDRGEGVRLVLGVEVDAAEAALDPGQPERGEVHGAARGVGLVVHVGAQPPHGRDDLGVDDARVDVARQHQRHARGVDQHRIGLVDDGDVRLRHDGVVEVGDQPVAQHVEADLVDRHVHDVVRVGRAAFCALRRLAQPADGDAQLGVERAHPLGVAAGEVVVHGDHVHPTALPGVARGGDRPDQGLALAGSHLDDVAGQQRGRRLHLDVERALVERLLRGRAGHGQVGGELAVAPGALRGNGAVGFLRGRRAGDAAGPAEVRRSRALQEPSDEPAHSSRRSVLPAHAAQTTRRVAGGPPPIGSPASARRAGRPAAPRTSRGRPGRAGPRRWRAACPRPTRVRGRRSPPW